MTLALDPRAYAVVLVAGFVAGLIDAIGGGGGLVSLPALLAVGLPPSLALGTNKGQAVFGTAGATFSFARAGLIDRRRAAWVFPAGLLGGLAGGLVQMAVRPDALRPVVLVLMIGAAALLVLKPKPRPEHAPPQRSSLWLVVIAGALGFYDGFFGPGTGAMLIVAFTWVLGDGLLRASANAKVGNLASNIASLVLFAWRGTVLWRIALPMAIANTAGGFVGSHLAIRRGDRFVRVLVLVAVAAATIRIVHDLRR